MPNPHSHTVWYCALQHRHGFNTYMAATEAELDKQVAEYCATWPNDASDVEAMQRALVEGNLKEAIKAYFSDNETEFLESWGSQTVEFR